MTAPFKVPKPAKKDTVRRIIVLGGLAIIIIGLASVGFGWIKHRRQSPKSSSATAKVSSASTVQPSPNSTAPSTIYKYTSNGNDLDLTFAYPSSWSVTPSSNDNSSDQTISLSSPLSSITTAAGSVVTGKVIVTVRPGSDSINELSLNSPVAALASTQIAYNQPSSSQYQYPYISYVHFSNGSTVSGAFEEVIITGSQTFTAGQSISAGYLAGLDPIISAAFYQCTTSSCSGSGQTSLGIVSNTWQNATIFEQVLAVFQSFSLN